MDKVTPEDRHRIFQDGHHVVVAESKGDGGEVRWYFPTRELAEAFVVERKALTSSRSSPSQD